MKELTMIVQTKISPFKTQCRELSSDEFRNRMKMNRNSMKKVEFEFEVKFEVHNQT